MKAAVAAAFAAALLGSASPAFATSKPGPIVTTTTKPAPTTTTTTRPAPKPTTTTEPVWEENPIIQTSGYPPRGNHPGEICDYYLSGKVLCRPYDGPPFTVFPKLPPRPGVPKWPLPGTYVDPPKPSALSPLLRGGMFS